MAHTLHTCSYIKNVFILPAGEKCVKFKQVEEPSLRTPSRDWYAWTLDQQTLVLVSVYCILPAICATRRTLGMHESSFNYQQYNFCSYSIIFFFLQADCRQYLYREKLMMWIARKIYAGQCTTITKRKCVHGLLVIVQIIIMLAKNYCWLHFTLNARECVHISIVLVTLTPISSEGEGSMLRKVRYCNQRTIKFYWQAVSSSKHLNYLFSSPTVVCIMKI